MAQPGRGRGARPPPRNWVHKKIPGCTTEITTVDNGNSRQTTCIQLPTHTINEAQPAFACHWYSNRSISPARRSRSCKAGLLLWDHTGTYRRMDNVLFHRPCSAYSAGSANKMATSQLQLTVCVQSKAHNVFRTRTVCVCEQQSTQCFQVYAAVFEFFAVFPVFCTADFPSISDTRCSICFSTLSRIVFSIFCKQQKTQKFSYFTKTVEPYAAQRISVSCLLTQNAAQGIASMFRAAWIFIFWHILIRCTGHFFADF